MGNETLWHSTLNTNDYSFSGWTNIPGSTDLAPMLAASSSLNSIQLAVKGMSGDIYINELVGGIWQGWNGLSSGSTNDSPAITATNNVLQIIVRSLDGIGLWHCKLDLITDVQSEWSPVSGSTPSTPKIIS